jgi:hypothetical protein
LIDHRPVRIGCPDRNPPIGPGSGATLGGARGTFGAGISVLGCGIGSSFGNGPTAGPGRPG